MTIRPTDEQQAIIDAPEDRDIAVDALAGAAKTTTLELRAKAHPNQKILYVALNKAVQLEAADRFPSNVTCRTTHALAFRSHGLPYKHKLGNLRPFDVRRALNPSMPYNDSMTFAALCIEVVKNYMASADEEITEAHVPRAKAASMGMSTPDLVEEGQRLWRMICNTRNTDVAMPHDGYLKLYQLSRPDLSEKFDAIYLDEAQDTNPAMYAIFADQQNLQRVAVGDRNQSIYRFRGSMDVMSELPDAERYALTGSFRFGPEVAGVANILLGTYLNETLALRGLGEPTEVVPASVEEDVPPGNRAYLYRTNAGLFDQAVRLMDQGYEGMCWLGGIESYQMETLLDVYRLSVGQTREIKDRMVRSFDGLDALRSYAEAAEDLEIKARIKVVDEYRHKLPKKVRQLRALALDEPGHGGAPVLSTAHRCKGREFDHVILGEDFPPLVNETDAPIGDLFPLTAAHIPPNAPDAPTERDEIFLAYVAATRARKTLVVNSEIGALLRWWKQVGRGQAENATEVA